MYPKVKKGGYNFYFFSNRERERERIKLTKMLYLGKKVVTNRLVLGKRKIKGKEAIGDCQINHKIRQLGYVLMQTCCII